MQNSDIQHEVLFMIVQQAFLFHFSKLERQSAALNGEKVRELLAGERDVKLDRAAPLRLGGEIGHELGARRALGDVRELFIEQQVFPARSLRRFRMMRLWCAQAEGQTVKRRLTFKNSTVVGVSVTTLTLETLFGAQAKAAA